MAQVIFVFLCLVLASCGYVGDPLPPALKIPLPVTDLAVKQVGQSLLVSFTIPAKTMEGLNLEKLGAIELKVGTSPAVPFNAEAWSRAAKVANASANEPGKVEASIPVQDWANQEVVLGVRVANQKMRVSPWSNFATIKVVPALMPPPNFRAIASAQGVDLDWTDAVKRPRVEWRIFRLGPGEPQPTEMATVAVAHFTDTGAVYDTTYKYSVVALEGQASSEISEPVTITPVDSFAPVTPLGLSVLSGPTSNQLSWERNQESDLASYRVFRSVGEGAVVKVFESPTAASYRDSDIKSGQLYRYAVSAVDKKGNESPKSQAVEIRIP